MKNYNSKETIKEVDFYRVNNCVNGNPRYVFHFLELDKDYNKAHKKALSMGATKYRAKWFGGGFVVQSYNLNKEAEEIINLRNK